MTAAPRLPPASDVSALVLGAGTGTRLGNRSKAFLAVGGVTLVERVVERLRPYCAEILVGLPPGEVETGRALVEGAGVRVLAGGASRQDTVEILLGLSTRPIVLVHEVARPFAPPDLYQRVLAAGAASGAATAFLRERHRDSLGLAEGDDMVAPLPRERIVFTQTPQAYLRTTLEAVYSAARQGGWSEPSTAALVARAGYRVRLVPGDPGNLKITYDEDWEEAKARLTD